MENGKPFVKSPAFQMYPTDFLSDKNTLVMPTVEIGAYCLLLFVCWDENGLPDNMEDLAAIARLSVKQFQPMWERHIERCFQKRDDGKWTHKRLEKERQKQAVNRAKRQAAGTKGAETRWQTDSNAVAMLENENGKRIANDSLSDFSLQIPSKEQIHSFSPSEPVSGNGRKADALFESLAEVCRIDLSLCTNEQRGALNQTLGMLRKAGHTPEEVRKVGAWWVANDWRGQKGQAPKPAQIREVWKEALTPAKRPMVY